ncbi:MAG: hypothetical protein AB1716_21205 [Planctomycetota bacterium]
MNALGFFEDFFDGNPAAVAAFWHVVDQCLASEPRVSALPRCTPAGCIMDPVLYVGRRPAYHVR